MVRNAEAGSGEDLNTHATSDVVLVFDDSQHKVIQEPLMQTWELWGGGASEAVCFHENEIIDL